MRVTTAFNRLLRLPGARVRDVGFAADGVIVTVALRRRRAACSVCGQLCPRVHDRARRRLRGPLRLSGPADGQGADRPAAQGRLGHRRRDRRPGGGRPARRGPAGRAGDDRLRRDLLPCGQRYLTTVCDHATGAIVWARPGRNAQTLQAFFDELGDRRASIRAVSIDMNGGYEKAVRTAVPAAEVCFDPFHVVRLAGDAVDQVRRAEWNQAGKSTTGAGRWVKALRWSLLKAPERQTVAQIAALHEVSQVNRRLYRAFLLKEELRLLYHLDDPATAPAHLDAWLAWASRSKLKPFVKLARTLRARRAGVLAAIRLGLSNGRMEGLHSKVRCSPTAPSASADPTPSSPSSTSVALARIHGDDAVDDALRAATHARRFGDGDLAVILRHRDGARVIAFPARASEDRSLQRSTRSWEGFGACRLHAAAAA